MNKLEISWPSLWRVLFMLILAVAFFLTREVLAILFLAIIISSALDAPVSFLERRRVPRVLGTLLVFLIILAVLAWLLYIIVPVVILELGNLFESLNQWKLPLLESLDIAQMVKQLNARLEGIASLVFSGSASFFKTTSAIVSNLVLIVSTFILSIYLTVNRDGVENFIKAILPAAHENYAIRIYLRVRKRMGYWLQGQILLSLIIGVSTFVGLLILGVKYSLILGILAGILEIVPIAGPIIAGALAILVGLSTSWALGFYALLLFIVIQQAESHLLVPLIMKKTVGVSPVVVVIALLAGSQVAGLIGIILSVPVAVVIQEMLEDWGKKKILGQQKLRMQNE